MKGILYGVSIGPGDPELITLKAVNIIRNCDIIAVPAANEDTSTALHIVRKVLPEIDSKKIIQLFMPMTRDKKQMEEYHQKAANIIKGYLDQANNVAMLTLGDATIYSTYLYVHRLIKEGGYETQIIPGVPSFCASAARLGIGLVEGAEPLHILPASYEGIEQGLALGGTKVLMKIGKSIDRIKRILKHNGQDENAMLIQKCGMEGEQTLCSLDQADENTSYFSVIIVKE